MEKTPNDFKKWDEYEAYAKGFLEGQKYGQRIMIDFFMKELKK